MKRSMIIEIICGLLTALLVYAAISKLLNYSTFLLQLRQDPFITIFANVLAWALPAIEITISIFLVVSSLRLLGLYAALFLLTLFTAYITALLIYGHFIPCSCGGVLAVLSWKQHIILNTGFAALAVGGIFLQTFTNNIELLKK